MWWLSYGDWPIFGRVVDAATGAGIRGAFVQVSWSGTYHSLVSSSQQPVHEDLAETTFGGWFFTWPWFRLGGASDVGVSYIYAYAKGYVGADGLPHRPLRLSRFAGSDDEHRLLLLHEWRVDHINPGFARRINRVVFEEAAELPNAHAPLQYIGRDSEGREPVPWNDVGLSLLDVFERYRCADRNERWIEEIKPNQVYPAGAVPGHCADRRGNSEPGANANNYVELKRGS